MNFFARMDLLQASVFADGKMLGIQADARTSFTLQSSWSLWAVGGCQGHRQPDRASVSGLRNMVKARPGTSPANGT